MKERILFVDDDPLVLSSLKRRLRNHFEIDTALGGEEALQTIATNGPYSVVISDYMMPEMNGVELLAKVRELAPEAVRIMLTGSSELKTAIDAVNEGNIFQYHLKPWSKDGLVRAIETGVDKHRKAAREKRHIETMTEYLVRAGQLQQTLIPSKPPVVDGLDIAGKTIWCDETGGDFFDFIQYEEWGRQKIGIVVGDVSGHGVSSALLMSAARAFLRERARGPGGAAGIVADVNRRIARDTRESGFFVSLFYAEFDLKDKCIRWVRAGHEPAIIYDSKRAAFDEFSDSGLLMGVSEHTEYTESACRFNSGQIIWLGTDGIHETRNANGEMFGKGRLKAVLREHAHRSAQEIINAMVNALAQFRHPAEMEDDATFLVIKVL